MPAFLSVGRLYHPNRTQWPEVAQYSYRAGEHELVVFLSRPTAKEVDDFRRGASSFALVVRPPLIVLCYRCGSQPWSDAPYSWHLVSPDERDMPSSDIEADKRAILSVTLVDAETGIVQAIRMVSWSPEFTRASHAAIREQAATPWDARAYDRALSELYDAYPTTDALVAAASHETDGGA